MKRKIFTVAIVAVFAACNSNPKTNTQTTTATTVDSSGFRNNSFADKGQVIELKGVSDTIVTGDGNRYVKVDPNQPKQQSLAANSTPEPSVKIPRSTTHHSSTTTRHRSSGRSSSGGYSGSGSSGGGYSGAGSETASTVPARKKGWSKAAKGAVIGAGVGAIGGAIISKKKGLGAVIGGVVGGAGGYIIGRNKDKKDGRY